MKTKLLSVALFAIGTAFAAEPAPLQLRGVLNTPGETLFGLSTQTGDANAWVSVGKTFAGFKLKSYDEAKSLLVLERDGKTYELALAAARLDKADPVKGTQATIADATKVVDQMRFEEMIAKSLEAQKKAMAGMAQKMARQGGANVDPKDMEEHMNKVMDAMAQAMDIPQLKKDMTQIYAETFTKEELTAISDFQATPAGQSMNDKQPEIQEKLQAIMMPRVMSAMPKIQQLGMEFARQQQEKAKAAKAAAAAAAQPTAPAAPSNATATPAAK